MHKGNGRPPGLPPKFLNQAKMLHQITPEMVMNMAVGFMEQLIAMGKVSRQAVPVIAKAASLSIVLQKLIRAEAEAELLQVFRDYAATKVGADWIVGTLDDLIAGFLKERRAQAGCRASDEEQPPKPAGEENGTPG